MAPSNPPSEHPFKIAWPDQLHRAIAGESAAREGFASFALEFYRNRRWRLMRTVPDAHHDDLIQEMTVHALDRLAKYRSRPGIPFEAWLLAIGSRLVLDRLRSETARRKREEVWSNELTRTADTDAADPALVSRAQEALSRLGAKCRLLLALFQDGLSPAEMVPVVRAALGDPTLNNKRVSDDLGYCRRMIIRHFGELTAAPTAAREAR